jgi:GPH family glycoside/pentoside/hexuronide:cation symporter
MANDQTEKHGEKVIFLKEKLGYAAGDTASCIFYVTFSMFLNYFYTDVFGITAAAVGTMLLITRIWDFLNDPLMGLIADRTNTRFGKFRPWILWMAFPLALIGILTFTTPDLGPTGKLIYAYITYTLMMMAYTAINVPYGALLGVMTSHPEERSSLSSYRFVGAFIGNLIIQGTLIGLIAYFGTTGSDIDRMESATVSQAVTSPVADSAAASNGLFGPQVDNQQRGFQFSMGFFGLVAAFLFLFTFWACKERVAPLKETSNVIDDIKDSVRNRPWLVLMLMCLITLIWVSLRNASMLYYFKYYVGTERVAVPFTFSRQFLMYFFSRDFLLVYLKSPSGFMVTGTIATILGVTMTTKLTIWLGGKKRTYLIVSLINAGCLAAFYFAGPKDFILMYATHIIASFFTGPIFPMTWAMFADTADYFEWKFGRRATGLILSAGTFSQKMGWTVGGAIAGWILAWYGYVANQEQNEGTIFGIKMMMSILPAIGSVLAAATSLLYNLDAEKMQKIGQELTDRKRMHTSIT